LGQVQDPLCFPREIDLGFLLADPLEGTENAPAVAAAADANVEAAAPDDAASTATASHSSSSGSSESETNALNAKPPPSSHVYELSSILMHSGSADRGHYYAYVKDPFWAPTSINADNNDESYDAHISDDSTAAAAKTTALPSSSSDSLSSWLCFNDASVHRLNASEEDAIFTGLPTPQASSSAPSSSSSNEAAAEGTAAADDIATIASSTSGSTNGNGVVAAESSKSTLPTEQPSIAGQAHASRNNAYMLVYRLKKQHLPVSATATTASANPSAPAVLNSAEAESGVAATSDTATNTDMTLPLRSGITDVAVPEVPSVPEVPPALAADVQEANTEWEKLQACHQIHAQMVELVVYHPIIVGAQQVAVPSMPNDIGSDIATTSDRMTLNDARITLQLHNSTKWGDALAAARSALVTLEESKEANAALNDDSSSGGATHSDKVASSSANSSALLANVASERCRLRRFDVQRKCGGATYGQWPSDTSLQVTRPYLLIVVGDE
jgi:hypothetical protein